MAAPHHIADGVKALNAGLQPFIDDDMPAVDFRADRFEPQILRVADNADREDDALRLNHFGLAALSVSHVAFAMGGTGFVEFFDLRAGEDFHALFLELLFSEF